MQVIYNRSKKSYEGFINGALVVEAVHKMAAWIQLVRISNQKLYDLMRKAYDFIPAKMSRNSAIIVALGGVKPMGGKLAQVTSQDGRKTYTISGAPDQVNKTAHCDCLSYRHGVYTIRLGSGVVVTCKHIIALRFAIALGAYDVTPTPIAPVPVSAISRHETMHIDVVDDINDIFWG